MDKKTGESRFSVEDFLVSLVPKFSEGESFTAASISGVEKVWIKKGGGEYQDFLSKSFVSQCREFQREPFAVALFSGIDKVRIKGGGEVS